MIRTHRARLTLVAAATAGLLLALTFAGIFCTMRAAEMRTVDELLAAAARGGINEISKNVVPDLREVTGATPGLSVAVYTLDGRITGTSGPTPLAFNLAQGRHTLSPGGDQVVQVYDEQPYRAVASLPWEPRRTGLVKLAILLGLLWPMLTAAAAIATWVTSRSTFKRLEDLAEEAEQAAVVRSNVRLSDKGQDEFSYFANRLNGFLDRMDESVRSQEQFVADAAHELRTPLAVLRTAIESTLARERDSDAYRRTLTTSLHEVERLATLVELLLQSAVPSTTIHEGIDLEVAVEMMHSRWFDRFTGLEVGLEIETVPIRVCIQEAEFEVLTDNLLSNALRVSAPGTTCKVSVSLEADQAVINICDRGPGIPHELQQAIFDRFTRGDFGRSRAAGGYGIGLAVCKRLVTSRQGTITAQSREGGGTCFQIRIPATITAPSASS